MTFYIYLTILNTMSLFASIKRLFTPTPIEIGSRWCSDSQATNPFGIALQYEVVEKKNGWVQLKTWYKGTYTGLESIKESTLRLCYTKIPPQN